MHKRLIYRIALLVVIIMVTGMLFTGCGQKQANPGIPEPTKDENTEV